MKPELTSTQVRARLAELVATSRSTATALSRMLRRDDRYLARFINKGVPERLEDADRRSLASFFGVDEYELGGFVGPRSH